MVSIKDIAQACGVSAATVSKALNGHSDIGAATRERILQQAGQMGYMPNAAARALKTNRTYNLGVLFVDEAQSGLTNEYFASVLNSFKQAAEAAGYDITFINHKIGGRRDSYLEHCRYRGVDGVVAACVQFGDPEVLELATSSLPFVTIDHVFNNRSSVLSNNADGVQLLVQHFAALGHQKIAFIHGEGHTSVTEQRLAGFFKACTDRGLAVPDAYIRASTYHDPAGAARETEALLALPEAERPTAILFPDDFSSIGGIQAIERAGLRIPADISVAGYDGNVLSTVMSPALTTYRQNTEELGRAAAELLIRTVENPRATLPEQRIIRGALYEGGTSGPPRA